MGTVDVRNASVSQMLYDLYDRAVDPTVNIDESPYQQALNKLFSTHTWGFREILLVVVIGMKLDGTYRASSGFYDCNPRAIYETPIKSFLIEKSIPHRKSGPLNVAKATVGLDMMWAAQRRPADVAAEVVNIVNYLEEDPLHMATRIDNVGISLLRRLIECADNVAALAIELEPNEDPDHLYHLCYELITKTPDAGNTPQTIAALLLKCYHTFFHTGIEVSGGDDRASVTSTTSKKPGDINEECAGHIYKVYEVTVKPFDLARIRDSYDCIATYNETNSTDINEIIVICRREDCPPDMEPSGLHGYLGRYIYQDIIYCYWDIYEWMSNMLQRMTSACRTGFYMLLNSYIAETNTAEAVKRLWTDLHSN